MVDKEQDADSELAYLAHEVYTRASERRVPTGWRKVRQNKFAFAVRRGDVVHVAFRGTKRPTDWGNNAMLVSGIYRLSPRYRDAKEFLTAVIEENPKAKITLTGHSQGAYTALELAREFNLPSVSYNAPSPIFVNPVRHLYHFSTTPGQHRSYYSLDPIGMSGVLNGGQQRFVGRWGHSAGNFLPEQ